MKKRDYEKGITEVRKQERTYAQACKDAGGVMPLVEFEKKLHNVIKEGYRKHGRKY